MYFMDGGKYIVGDPCYFFSDKDHSEWREFLNTNDFSNNAYGKLVESDIEVLVFPTAYGDGSYFDQDGREYLVDSGQIGMIQYISGDVPHGSHLIEFPPGLIPCKNKAGILQFGHIHIDTEGSDVNLNVYKEGSDVNLNVDEEEGVLDEY